MASRSTFSTSHSLDATLSPLLGDRLEWLVRAYWCISIVKFAFTFLFFQEQPKVATAVQALISVVFAFLLIFVKVSAKLVLHDVSWPPILKWIILYIGWTGASLAWTRSDSFGSAVGYWTLMLVDLLIVIGMYKLGETERISVAALKGYIAGAYLIDLIALIFANGDENGRLGDPAFLHPNNLGHFTAIAALSSLYFWQIAEKSDVRRRWWAVGSLVLSWMVVRTLSKTSIAAFCVSAAFMLLVGRSLQLKAKIKVILVAALLASVSYGFLSSYFKAYLEENPSDASTLTGRTVLWLRAGEMALERPVLGYGILSFRDYGPQDWEIRTVHGHNEWVTQVFQLGLIGVLLALIIYSSYFLHFKRVEPSLERKLGLSIGLFILIEGCASAEAIGLLFPLPLILVLTMWTRDRLRAKGRLRES